MKLTNVIGAGWLLLTALFVPAGAFAQDEQAETGPHQVIRNVTDQLLQEVRDGKQQLESDPEAYFASIESKLEPVVDFEFIAKNVMGVYWGEASAEQQQEFVQVFKRSMVKTYAKGMANYSDLKIEVMPPEGEVPEYGKTTVIQKVTAADGINRVAYTMGRRKGDDWKLINVVLDGVNLGKTFRSQFAQLMKEHDGDIDAAIANWQADT